MAMNGLIDTLQDLAAQYPAAAVEDEKRDVPRIAFNIDLSLQAVAPKPVAEIEICDIAGGIGLFSVGCAKLGVKRIVLIDDFNDLVNHRLGPGVLALHRSLNVEIVSRDVIAAGISDLAGPFDVITTFGSMEHWHHSPKRLFHEILQQLRPGGAFVIGVPNCMNLRKRIMVPLGRGGWSTMDTWYEAETFRGHVREPTVDDLRYIARDMGLADVKVYGRNFQGTASGSAAMRWASKALDLPLRMRPSLCSDIYVVGRKP